MINILVNWAAIGNSIIQALRTFAGYVAGFFCDFISILYNLFFLISKAEFLNSDFVTSIYRKVGLILGIFMVFKLSFSIIQSLVDPDKFNDKKNGFASIIVRCVVSIVLLGVTPAIFREAYSLQSLLIGANDSSENIIYKLIIGKDIGSVDNFGRVLSSELFFSFFTDMEDPKLVQGSKYDENSKDKYTSVVDINTLKKDVTEAVKDASGKKHYVSFSSLVGYLSLTEQDSERYYIEFDPIFSILFSVIVAWMLVMYCIQTGIRVIQLAYLQLIAPVPIFSYISDPDGAFKKWIQQCITTYLDLFIRFAIIYFIIYLTTYIIDQLNPDNLNSSLIASTGLDANDPYLVWIKIFLILGLLLFAKKVPELLKDLFPNLGGGAASLSMGLKAPKEVTGFAKKAATFGLGAVAGGVAGVASGVKNGYGVKGKIAGAFGGFYHGLAGGAKTKGNIFKNVQGGMSGTRHARQRALERQIYKIDNAKIMQEYQDNEAIMGAKKAIDDRAESQLLKTDAGAQAAQARLNYIETNVGKFDSTLGHTITTADVVAQKAAYKSYMDGIKVTWVNANASTDIEIAKQMQIIQNKTGNAINTYSDVDTANSTAKTRNSSLARNVAEAQYEKDKIQQKKSKIK